MGISDDLSSRHDQLEKDGTIEEDQLMISFCSCSRILPYSQCDETGGTGSNGSCCDIEAAGQDEGPE